MEAVGEGMPFIPAGRVDEVVLELERQRGCIAPSLSFRSERCRPHRLTAVCNCPKQSNEKCHFSPQTLPHSNASLRMNNNCHYSSVFNTVGRFQALLRAVKPKKCEIMTGLPAFSQYTATHFANRAKCDLDSRYKQEHTMERSENVSWWKTSV